jgi:hypothetical protein
MTRTVEKARDSANAQIAAAKQASLVDLRESKRQGLQQSADAAAASIAPFLVLRGQVSEISDRSLQSVVRNLLTNQKLKFVAILDVAGKVLASSDLTMVGKSVSLPSGLQIAKSRIGTNPALGGIVLGEAL